MSGNAAKEPRQAIWSTAMAEMLLDRVAQGVLTVAPDGRVTYANRRIAAMAGIPRASLLGAPLLQLAAEEERKRLGTTLSAGRDAPIQQRFVLPKSDGGEVPVLMSFAPLAHGQTSCLVTDLSDQKRREEYAERSSRFLATLAQELRNGLRPMQGALGALAHSQSLDENARRALASMLGEVDRMLALVDDLRRING